MGDLGRRLGRRVYGFRKQQRLTQAALAEKAKISNEFMSAVERGAKLPSLPVVERLAHALGVQIKDLFNFTSGPDKKLEPLPRDVMDFAWTVQELPVQQRRKLRSILKVLNRS